MKTGFKHFITAFLTIWLIAFVGPSFVESILDRIESRKIVHKDKTRIESGVEAQARNNVVLVYETSEGETERVIADRESFSDFATGQFQFLEAQRVRTKEFLVSNITHANEPIFRQMDKRIPDFADWYFSYTTTYKILGVAMSSAMSHALDIGVMPLMDAVALDVEEYLEQHFEEIVLKPEISDSIFQRNYFLVLDGAHKRYLAAMGSFENHIQEYISEQTTHYKDIDQRSVSMEIDWQRHINKVSMSGYEKGGGGALVGTGLTIGASATGKSIGATAVGTGVGKAFLAKLGAPFVGKSVSIAGSAAAGGGAGTAVGGPVGAVLGALVGISVDYALNEGVELVNRERFEGDARLALKSFENELNLHEATSIQNAVDVWFNDSINLILRF